VKVTYVHRSKSLIFARERYNDAVDNRKECSQRNFSHTYLAQRIGQCAPQKYDKEIVQQVTSGAPQKTVKHISVSFFDRGTIWSRIALLLC